MVISAGGVIHLNIMLSVSYSGRCATGAPRRASGSVVVAGEHAYCPPVSTLSNSARGSWGLDAVVAAVLTEHIGINNDNADDVWALWASKTRP